MNRSTSLYLDAIRLMAALVVFFGHLAGQRFTDGLFWQFGPFMDDAVVGFFVLSGYVIAHVIHKKEHSAAQYFIARAARIYSVALPALCLTFFLDYLGKSIMPSAYSLSWGYAEGDEVWKFISGMLFINQFSMNKVSMGSMLPYWSLGYEVWYYILFGLLFFYHGILVKVAACAALMVASPNIFILFPLWLMGYYAYTFSTLRKSESKIFSYLFLSSLLLYFLYIIFLKVHIIDIDRSLAILGEKNVVRRYTVALIFSMNLLGVASASKFFPKLPGIFEAGIRRLAGATFTIYLLHLPVAQFLVTISPWPPSDLFARMFILMSTFAIMLVISLYTDVLKVWLLLQFGRISFVISKKSKLS